MKGLQGALWELGRVPRIVRTDNLSAATHELKDSRGRAVNARYEAVLSHHGVDATRTNPRSSHDNGVAEQGHRRLKSAIAQALILRGSGDFDTEQEYTAFVRRVVDRRNRLAYDALCGWRGERADVEYVRILHLAATTMESKVDRALRRLLESGVSSDYAMVRRQSAPAPPPIPELKLPGTVDLVVYDRLLVGGAR